jgi:hypothetical protein
VSAAPQRKQVDDTEFDLVLGKIDAAIDEIERHKQSRQSRGPGTGAYSREQIRRTRQELVALQAEALADLPDEPKAPDKAAKVVKIPVKSEQTPRSAAPVARLGLKPLL